MPSLSSANACIHASPFLPEWGLASTTSAFLVSFLSTHLLRRAKKNHIENAQDYQVSHQEAVIKYSTLDGVERRLMRWAGAGLRN